MDFFEALQSFLSDDPSHGIPERSNVRHDVPRSLHLSLRKDAIQIQKDAHDAWPLSDIRLKGISSRIDDRGYKKVDILKNDYPEYHKVNEPQIRAIESKLQAADTEIYMKRKLGRLLSDPRTLFLPPSDDA